MTNELGTTLQDIEAKAERKREALKCVVCLEENEYWRRGDFSTELETIRKYIEES